MNATVCNILILASLVCGCSTTYTIVEPASRNPKTKPQFTDQILGKEVTVEFTDGNEAGAILFQLGDDSCTWRILNTSLSGAARTKDIRKVVRKNHLLGAVEGLGIGLVGGIAVGALLGRVIEGPPRGDFGGLGIVVGAGVVGAIGTIAGTIHGAVSGHKYKYEFDWLSREDSSGIGGEARPKQKQ